MIARWVQRARKVRALHLVVVNLRFLLGLAFLPASLKKLLGEPFTDASNHGPFHDFLHAFHRTGWFYPLVGGLQLAAALLLFTQRFALAGALLALAILTVITTFCWSTAVVPTAIVTTLMWLGTLGLIGWDFARWRAIFTEGAEHIDAEPAPIDRALWARCGGAMVTLYLASVLAHGGVYRPRGLELGEPSFYVLPAMLLLPVVTFVVERRRARAHAADSSAARPPQAR